MSEVQDIGELLKVLYATLGKRVTKIVVWAFLAIAFLFALKWAIEGIDWFIDRFALETLNLTLIINALVSALLAIILMFAFGCAIAVIIALPLRFGIDASQRRKVERMSSSIIALLEEAKTSVPEENIKKIQSFIIQAQDIGRPPLIFRILDRLVSLKTKK